MYICVSPGTVSDPVVRLSGSDVCKTEMKYESNSHYAVPGDLRTISREFSCEAVFVTFGLSL
jgi:hypothetical protein